MTLLGPFEAYVIIVAGGNLQLRYMFFRDKKIEKGANCKTPRTFYLSSVILAVQKLLLYKIKDT